MNFAGTVIRRGADCAAGGLDARFPTERQSRTVRTRKPVKGENHGVVIVPPFSQPPSVYLVKAMNTARELQRLDTAWGAFEQSYAGLSDTQLMKPGATGNWSARLAPEDQLNRETRFRRRLRLDRTAITRCTRGDTAMATKRIGVRQHYAVHAAAVGRSALSELDARHPRGPSARPPVRQTRLPGRPPSHRAWRVRQEPRVHRGWVSAMRRVPARHVRAMEDTTQRIARSTWRRCLLTSGTSVSVLQSPGMTMLGDRRSTQPARAMQEGSADRVDAPRQHPSRP